MGPEIGKAGKSIVIRLGCLAVTCAFSLGCRSEVPQAKRAAEFGIAVFHQRYNASAFHEIYLSSTADLRRVTPPDRFLQLLSGLRTQLGRCLSVHLRSWTVSPSGTGRVVSISAASRFEKGNAAEAFEFFVTGDVAALTQYTVVPTRGGPLLRVEQRDNRDAAPVMPRCCAQCYPAGPPRSRSEKGEGYLEPLA